MIGVAIIGTGAIAKLHIEAYKTFTDRCELRALCDLYPEKAIKLAQDTGINVDAYKEYTEVFSRDDIHLVSICLPPFFHGEVSIAALEAGKHVLVEKPMASSLEECDAMIAATEKSGAILSVVAQNRFKIPTWKVKNILNSGKCGKVLHSQVNSYWWRGGNYYDLWWRGTWEKEGGGCTLNHAVHHADLLLWMIGMPERVSSVMSNLIHHNSETEDFSSSTLHFENGSVAQFTASLIHHGEKQSMEFQTEKALLTVPWEVTSNRALENGFPENDSDFETSLQKEYDSIPEIPHEGHTGQIDDVLDAIEKRKNPLVDGRAGRRTLELIMGIYKSAVSGGAVSFPLAQDDPFYRKESMLAEVPKFNEKIRSVENFTTTDISVGRDVGK